MIIFYRVILTLWILADTVNDSLSFDSRQHALIAAPHWAKSEWNWTAHHSLCKIKAYRAYSGLLAPAFFLFNFTAHVYRIRRSPLIMSKESDIKRESLFCFLRGVFVTLCVTFRQWAGGTDRSSDALWWLEFTWFIHQTHPRNVLWSPELWGLVYTVVYNTILCLIGVLNTDQGMHSGFWCNTDSIACWNKDAFEC